MPTSTKPDWQYVHKEKLTAPQVRRLYAERGLLIDGPITSQLDQLCSAGFPSWTLYNLVRRYLLGATRTSVAFAYLSFNGGYEDLKQSFQVLRDELAIGAELGVALTRIVREGNGPSTHLAIDFSFRVDRLGSDVAITRDQIIPSTFRAKRLADGEYLLYSFPRTRFDYGRMLDLTEKAVRLQDPRAKVLAYASGPITHPNTMNFQSADEANSFFLALFSTGVLHMECMDVFTADTFDWDKGFDYRIHSGAHVPRDRAEVIRRMRLEGQQLNLDTGRVAETLGRGHAIHHFGATFQGVGVGAEWQIPIEIKFTSRPIMGQILGGPLLRKSGEEWIIHPAQEATQGLLLGVLEQLLNRVHGNEVQLPAAIRRISDPALA